MMNSNLGKGSWNYKKTLVTYNAKLHPGGYSRSMIVVDNGKKILHLTPVPVKGNQADLIESFETVSE